MNFNLIKELVISILIVMCIVLLVSIIFYNQASFHTVIPEVQEYALSDEMKADLETEMADDDNKEFVITYSIDAADLKKYEKTKEYNKGKKNPFAVETIDAETNVINTGSNNITSDNTDTTSTNTNFYEDRGTK